MRQHVRITKIRTRVRMMTETLGGRSYRHLCVTRKSMEVKNKIDEQTFREQRIILRGVRVTAGQRRTE